MNWKLIASLSLFGLVMGIGTVFVIPSNIEPFAWLAILGSCAYVIARRAPARYFLHGLLLGLANSVWVTASHVLLFDRYLAGHAQEAAMMQSMPLKDAPRLMMAVTGPVIGLISGVVIGLLAVLAGWLTRARRVPSVPTR